MPRISSWNDFIEAIGTHLTAANPLESLRAAGIEPGGQVADDLLRGNPALRVDPSVLARLQETHGPPPPMRVHVGRTPPPADPPSNPTGYALVAATDLSVLNEVLAELYRVGTIPHELTAGQTTAVVTLAQLRATCIGVPDDAELGPLHITAPPVAAASSITQMNLRLDIPFALPLLASQPVGLSGVLHLEIPLDFQVLEAVVRPALSAVGTAEGVLEIGPVSPVRPRSERARQELETAFVRAARGALILLSQGPDAPLSFTGSLPVHKSRFPNSTIDVTQVGAVTIRQSGRDYAVLGVNVERTHEVNPIALIGQPLPVPPHNLRMVVDQQFASDALSAVITSGDLGAFITRVGKRNGLGHQIDVSSGRVTFDAGKLGVAIQAVVRDVCAVFSDLGFKATLSGTPGVANGTLTIETSDVDLDLDNTDVLVCALTSALLGPLGIVLYAGLLAFAAAYNPSSSDLGIPVSETSEPLPGSDKVLDLELSRATMAPGVLTGDGRLELIIDPLRVYAYLRVVEGVTPRLTEPVSGATVELFELDSPAPAGDDVVIPEVGVQEVITPKFFITREVTYSPRADELLGTQTTDETGRVTFVVISNGIGGQSTHTEIKEDARTGNTLSSVTYRRTVGERLPDLAVTIRAATGEVLAQRRLVGLNVMNKRLGTFGHPVEVRVPRTGVHDPGLFEA